MKVLLPAPGTPVMPTRIDRTALRQQGGQDFLGQFLVGRRIGLDQGDGPGQQDPVPGQDPVDVFLGPTADAAADRSSTAVCAVDWPGKPSCPPVTPGRTFRAEGRAGPLFLVLFAHGCLGTGKGSIPKLASRPPRGQSSRIVPCRGSDSSSSRARNCGPHFRRIGFRRQGQLPFER